MKYKLTFTTDDGEVFKDVSAEGTDFVKLVQASAEALKKKHGLDLDKTYLSDYRRINE